MTTPDKRVLLVEGPTDEHLFYHLLRFRGIQVLLSKEKKSAPAVGTDDIAIRVKPMEGFERLRIELPVELKASGLERLGIAVDANANLPARWQSIRDRLVETGYNAVPHEPVTEGTIVHAVGSPIVGIWLMPDNQSPGMLEHFLKSLLPTDDSLWPRVKECVAHIPDEERRFPFQHEIKAQVHTWLAWQHEPGKPFGQAITAGYLDPNAPQAERLIVWIRRLFEETNTIKT